MLEPPSEYRSHYVAHLGDPGYWQPYVTEVLRRQGLPVAPVEPPFTGTFPTFLVGSVVVKLFGSAFDGSESHAAELAMHLLLADHPGIPAPALLAAGHLFDDGHRWPYLVTERLAGVAIRDAGLSGDEAVSTATSLGAIAARVHGLPLPSTVIDRDLVSRLRATAPARLRGFGLPDHLVEQVPDYLHDALPPSVLVHADLTADHVFVEPGGRLVGVIDWGDAIVADPFYELVPVYLDAFGGRRVALDAFLAGYGWERTDDFSRRALQGVLEFQFDAVTRIAELVDLGTLHDLDALAAWLLGP